MSERVAESSSPVPRKSGAGALETAVQAARDGAADATAAVDRVIPVVSEFLSRVAYTTCYSISYGVVFPCLLLARAVPKDNAVVHGLVDGARAAIDRVDEWQARRAESVPAGPAAAAGS
jgi:hypothetical protein